MSQDDDTPIEVPSAEIIHLALVRERFQNLTAHQEVVEEHEEAPIIVYIELMRGLETWAANTLCVDMERVRRDELTLEDELRDPVTDFERQQILRVLREMHNELAKGWGLE